MQSVKVPPVSTATFHWIAECVAGILLVNSLVLFWLSGGGLMVVRVVSMLFAAVPLTCLQVSALWRIKRTDLQSKVSSTWWSRLSLLLASISVVCCSRSAVRHKGWQAVTSRRLESGCLENDRQVEGVAGWG